jgi:hypothetical protein
MEFFTHEITIQRSIESDGAFVVEQSSTTHLFSSGIVDGPDFGNQRGRSKSKPGESKTPPRLPAPAVLGAGFVPSSYSAKAVRPPVTRTKATFSAGAPYNKKLRKKLFQGLQVSVDLPAQQSVNTSCPALPANYSASDLSATRHLSPQPSPRLLPHMDMLPVSAACEEILCDLMTSAGCALAREHE